MAPEMILNNTPLDYELNEILGTPASDYLVLYADGKRVDFWGTPIDSAVARQKMDQSIKMLNDQSDDFWLRCYKARAAGWHRLLGDIDPFDDRPNFTYAVSRTCAAYTKHIQAAIGLLEKYESKMKKWTVKKARDGSSRTEIIDLSGIAHRAIAATTAESIAEAFRSYIQSNRENPCRNEA